VKYNISDNNIEKVLTNIKRKLEENIEVINKLIKIDYQYCKIKTNIEMLKKVVDKFQGEKIDIQNEQKVLIKYNGNPCITLNFSILAILTKKTIYLDCNQNMLGINKFIVQLVNRILEDFQTDEIVYLTDGKISLENIDKIICIDDINRYNLYLSENNEKAKFCALNYIDFYSNSEEFQEITDLIYLYAEENQIPIESYSELDIDEAIKMMKNGLGKKVVILTKNEQVKQDILKNITDKEIYINQNPFEKEISILSKEIFDI